MKKEHRTKRWYTLIVPLLLSTMLLFVNCKDEKDETEKPKYDPSKPVEFSKFLPEAGGSTSQMVIDGENFGTDPSLIKVFVNDKQATLVGTTGSSLLVIVPARAGTGKVKVQIGKGDEMKEIISEKKFDYTFRHIVRTYAGFTDKDGKTAIVDGVFDATEPAGSDKNKAQFEEPYWLTFDQDKNLYLLEEHRGLRFIDTQKKTITTKFRSGNGLDRPRSATFNPTWDTLYVTNDQGDHNGISTAVLTPESDFRIWNTITRSKQCNGGAVQPQTGDFFFNSYEFGQVFKLNRETLNVEELYRISDVNWEFNMQFAPSGDFAYIVVKNQHYILKAEYDRTTRKLKQPLDYVIGAQGQRAHADGVTGAARFAEPHQGAFDEHDNFYLCDQYNQCIRKITPDGVVSTFAGRPGNYGYTDGTLRDAQFDQPMGIVYDKDSGIFYIADMKNRRIRTIQVE